MIMNRMYENQNLLYIIPLLRHIIVVWINSLIPMASGSDILSDSRNASCSKRTVLTNNAIVQTTLYRLLSSTFQVLEILFNINVQYTYFWHDTSNEVHFTVGTICVLAVSLPSELLHLIDY